MSRMFGLGLATLSRCDCGDVETHDSVFSHIVRSAAYIELYVKDATQIEQCRWTKVTIEFPTFQSLIDSPPFWL